MKMPQQNQFWFVVEIFELRSAEANKKFLPKLSEAYIEGVLESISVKYTEGKIGSVIQQDGK